MEVEGRDLDGIGIVFVGDVVAVHKMLTHTLTYLFVEAGAGRVEGADVLDCFAAGRMYKVLAKTFLDHNSLDRETS